MTDDPRVGSDFILTSDGGTLQRLTLVPAVSGDGWCWWIPPAFPSTLGGGIAALAT